MQLGLSPAWQHQVAEHERNGNEVGVWERREPVEAQQGRQWPAAAGVELEVWAASVLGAGTELKGQLLGAAWVAAWMMEPGLSLAL